MVNTPGGCLKVRISFEAESLGIDCLPSKMLVFVDGTQMYQGDVVAHLTGRGWVYSYGLVVAQNPAESWVPFDQRPAQLGSVAFTAPDGNVWVLGGNGAGAQQITGTGNAKDVDSYYSSLAWSPDGATLLMRRDAGDSHDVQVFQPGRGVRTVYPPVRTLAPVNPGVAAWSADAGHVLVTDYAESGDACSRSANQFAVRSLDLNSGAVTEMYHGQHDGFVHALVASPDGRNVAVLFGANCDAVSFNLCLLALQPDVQYGVQPGDLRCPRNTSGGDVAWSPDGRLLAFTSRLQGRGDESALSTGLPLQLMDARSATHYPIAWPLRADRNIIGVVWLSDNRTLRIEEETPRDLADTVLPERTIRRVTIDGSRFPSTEAAGDRLLSIRPALAPSTVHGDYVLATGARGELWVEALGQQDARWQLTDLAAGAFAWSP
jgi:hypothetical protein